MNSFEQYLIDVLLEVTAKGTGERVGRALKKRIGPNQPRHSETLEDPETEGQRKGGSKYKSDLNLKHPEWRAELIKQKFVDRAYNKSKTARDARGGDERGEDWSSVTDAENKEKADFDTGKERGQQKSKGNYNTWRTDKRGGKTKKYWRYGDGDKGV